MESPPPASLDPRVLGQAEVKGSGTVGEDGPPRPGRGLRLCRGWPPADLLTRLMSGEVQAGPFPRVSSEVNLSKKSDSTPLVQVTEVLVRFLLSSEMWRRDGDDEDPVQAPGANPEPRWGRPRFLVSPERGRACARL